MFINKKLSKTGEIYVNTQESEEKDEGEEGILLVFVVWHSIVGYFWWNR